VCVVCVCVRALLSVIIRKSDTAHKMITEKRPD